jgi:hypothetical protein
MKRFLVFVVPVLASATLLLAQPQGGPPPGGMPPGGMPKQGGRGPQLSPAAEATGTIAGKALSIKYSAPSVRSRQIFGAGGLLSKDPHYPVWRAGANAATALHTEADLTIGKLKVPKGDYTLFVNVQNPDAWVLVVSKATGEWGLSYDASKDLGQVPMTMSKPSAPIETLKYTIAVKGNTGTIELAWENHVAQVAVSAK